MHRIQCAIAVAFMLALATGGAQAEASAKVLLEKYDAEPGFHQVLETFLEYNDNGLSWANTFLRNLGRDPLFCPPQNTVLTSVQLIEIVRQHIKSEPKQAEAPMGLALLLALRGAFPCK